MTDSKQGSKRIEGWLKERGAEALEEAVQEFRFRPTSTKEQLLKAFLPVFREADTLCRKCSKSAAPLCSGNRKVFDYKSQSVFNEDCPRSTRAANSLMLYLRDRGMAASDLPEYEEVQKADMLNISLFKSPAAVYHRGSRKKLAVQFGLWAMAGMSPLWLDTVTAYLLPKVSNGKALRDAMRGSQVVVLDLSATAAESMVKGIEDDDVRAAVDVLSMTVKSGAVLIALEPPGVVDFAEEMASFFLQAVEKEVGISREYKPEVKVYTL